jgi:hypothetical protein
MSTEEPTDPSLLDSNHTLSVEREVLERLKQSELHQHVMKLPKLYQGSVLVLLLEGSNSRLMPTSIGLIT